MMDYLAEDDEAPRPRKSVKEVLGFDADQIKACSANTREFANVLVRAAMADPTNAEKLMVARDEVLSELGIIEQNYAHAVSWIDRGLPLPKHKFVEHFTRITVALQNATNLLVDLELA